MARAPGLATIGYEGRTLAQFLAELAAARVTLLCDVRRNAISRKPGFSKSKLAAGCAKAGIRYEHVPELGIAKEQRRAVRTPADRAQLFQTYEKLQLPAESAALARVAGWIREGERVALVCLERDPHDCHRERTARALQRRLRDKSPVLHI